jgi:hypothetical protein
MRREGATLHAIAAALDVSERAMGRMHLGPRGRPAPGSVEVAADEGDGWTARPGGWFRHDDRLGDGTTSLVEYRRDGRVVGDSRLELDPRYPPRCAHVRAAEHGPLQVGVEEHGPLQVGVE